MLNAAPLAVAMVATVSLVACAGGDDVPAVATLDEAAAQACEEFAPIGGQVRRRELEGPPLYRALQDVWNAASRSENTAVVEASQTVLSAAIQDDRRTLTAAITELQSACGLPFD